MSNPKKKTAPATVQMELPWSVLPSQKYRAGSCRRHEAVSEALKSALSGCGLGRDTVSEELMDCITASLQVVGSKEYFRLYKRTHRETPWQAISLDMAAL